MYTTFMTYRKIGTEMKTRSNVRCRRTASLYTALPQKQHGRDCAWSTNHDIL